MPELTLTDGRMIALAATAALMAGFVRGFTGFGGPAVMILVLVQFYSPLSVITKVLLIDFAANVKLLPTTAKEVDWRTAGVVLIASLVGAPLGLLMLEQIDPVLMKRVVAGVVAACSVLMLTGLRYRRALPVWVVVSVGVVAGAAFGATMIALVAVTFWLAGPAPANVNRANVVYWGMVMSAVLIAYHAYAGNIGWGDAWRSAAVGVVYWGSTVLGSRLFRASGERVYRGAVLWLMLLLSAVGLTT